MEIVKPAWAGLYSSPLIAQSWRHSLSICKPSPFHSSSSRSSSSSSASNGPVEGESVPRATQQESRSSILRRLDLELAAGNETQALSLVASAELRGFGSAAQVPQRLYSIADLRLNDIEASRFLSPVDSTLGDVRRNLQIAAAFGSIVLWQTLQPTQIEALSAFLALLLISGIDLVVYNGGVEALLLDTVGRIVSEKYKTRVAQHEAGHFLIAYLLGILPKSYTLSSLDAYRREGSFNVQAGTTFVDTEFQDEVKSGKLSAGSLNKYSCIALAGVAAEYLLFGVAEGGLADIQQLDRLLKSLNFTQMKADSQVRWAVLNVITILRGHRNVLSKLASAMLSNRSIGECIDVIETELLSAAEI
eukprot:c14256_g1_i1 orf=83-1165(+)